MFRLGNKSPSIQYYNVNNHDEDNKYQSNEVVYSSMPKQRKSLMTKQQIYNFEVQEQQLREKTLREHEMYEHQLMERKKKEKEEHDRIMKERQSTVYIYQMSKNNKLLTMYYTI